MENSNYAGGQSVLNQNRCLDSKVKIKNTIMHIVALFIFTCIVSRGPLMEESFICGIAFVTYMMSRSISNFYLVIPAVAVLIPLASLGYHTWGYIIATGLCALIFVISKSVEYYMWQRALLASFSTIIAITVYSLAAKEVYRISLGQLVTEGIVIFILVYCFDVFHKTIGGLRNGDSKAAVKKQHSYQISMMAFVVIVLLVVNGLQFVPLVWMTVMFMSLWALISLGLGEALLVVAVGGAAAALIGQEQWEIMITIMMGLLCAFYVKEKGFAFVTLTFMLICHLLDCFESILPIGADKYFFMMTSIIFIVVYWKFNAQMREIIKAFAWDRGAEGDAERKYVEKVLKDKTSQMSDMIELYATYLDSRTIFANQFNVTKQIIDDVRWQISRQGMRTMKNCEYKFELDIAISQCAASGSINGDCSGWQDIGDGRVVMVVSDGMGKGKKAAAESLMVTKTIISLLKSGVTVDLALKTINTIMLMKDDEDSYATLDMVIINKHTGKAKFYKIGAAPTLIRRKESVEEVILSEVPLGIVNGLKIRYVEATLKKDDRIIMMSDGVSDSGGKIRETVVAIRSKNPQTMCDLIINRAADSYVGRERDDLTVMVARIL